MKKIFVAFIAATTLLAGCSKDDANTTVPNDGTIPLKLQGEVIAPRVTDVAFEAGDLVGLYVTNGQTPVYTNEKLTAYSSALIASEELYYPAGAASVDIFAYYPYQENPVNPATIEVPQDQDAETFVWSDYDVLAAAVSGQEPSYSPVSLKFNHLMAKVTVDVEMTGVGATAEREEAVGASLSLATSGKLNIQTGEVSDLGAAQALQLKDGRTAIVLPQTIAQGTKLGSIVTLEGQSFDIVASKEVKLEGGKNNIIKVTVQVDEYIKVYVSCSIADWDEGDNIFVGGPTVNE